jgi:Tol biopolymer transport system component
VKLTARIAATFRRSGSARTDSVGDAVTAAVPRDFKGTSASTSARIGRALVVLVLAITGLGIAASSALAATAELKIDPTVTPRYTTVEVSGEIDPKGHPLEWFLQISADGGQTWQEGYEFGGSPRGEITEAEENTPKPLTGLIQEGLAPGTSYKVRLGAFDYTAEELVFSEEPSPEFTTETPPTPTVTINPVAAPTASTAHFSGKITPNAPAGAGSGADVAWHFVCEPSCPADEGEQTVSASAGETEVELEAGELQPSTTYEVRLVGKNAGDPVTAGPVTFQTEALPAPTITLDPITTFTDTTATFVGHIDPNKPATGEAAASAVHWTFQCQPGCPGLSGGTVPGAATGAERDVEVHATGLEPNTAYTVTLTGSNRGGPVSTAPETFSTIEVPATVGVGPGGAIGVGGYRMEGTVNPHNSVISECFFEWGPDVNYGHTAPCEPAPGSDNKVNFVTASLSGLTVNAAYHFRLATRNGTGLVRTPDEIFVAHEPCPNETIREEQGSTYLPECRGYEQVSPAFKEGFPPAPIGYTDNGRLAFTSSGNFAGNGNALGAGPGGNPYLATRSESGWSTEALSPSGPDYITNYGTQDGWPKGLSSDLSSTLWAMRRGDQPEDVSDLYVGRDDAFTRIGPLGPGSMVQASDDLSHVVFLAASGVVGEGIGIYEYVGDGSGGSRMVSVDNAGQPIEPACASRIGGSLSTYHAVSADGHTIFWTPQCGSSAVYARVDGATTLDVSESQCTRSDCNAESPASFQGADASGTRVYFTTNQQLVDGDTDETNDLYECDIPSAAPAHVGAVNPCPDLREVSGAASGAEVQGVTRISEDGSRVYFVATGVLASNTDANKAQAVAGDHNLYVWTRDAADPAGETQFVARLDPADGPTSTGGLWGSDYYGRPAQTTDDGRYLVFATYARLIDHGPQADTDNSLDIYRYDAETGALTRLSTDVDGAGGNEPGRDAQITPVDYDTITFPGRRPPRTVMSDDGGSVVFTTDEALAPGDTNGTGDTYLWNNGRVSLISSGKPSQDGPFENLGEPFATSIRILALISPSGRDVYFTTTARLVSGDEDTVMDIYDARVDGGFAPTPTPTPCAGESCRAQAPPPPASSRSTTQEAGSGNPPTVKRCPKGKVKKHGRCVKKQSKKHRRAKHRQAAKHHHAAHRTAEDKGGRK